MKDGKTLAEHCIEIGRYGGLSKSEAKKKAAQANSAKARMVVAANRKARKERRAWNHGWKQEYGL